MSVTSPDDRITHYEPVVATTSFAADFPVFDNDDIKVFVDGVERTDFAVSATYVQGISNDARAVFNPGIIGMVDVVGARDPRRTNRFVNGAPLQIWQQNLALDTAEAEIQEAKRDINRSHRAPYGEEGGVFSASEVAAAQGYAEAALQARADTLEFKEHAEGAATSAAQSAASLNLPSISPADVGKTVVIKPDGSGYDVGDRVPDGGVTNAKVASPETPEDGVDAAKIKLDLSDQFAVSVVRLLSDKFKDMVSARDFGAYGLGNDDTTELQAFLNEMKPTGLKAWVPRGEYGLSSTLLLNNQGTNVDPGTEPAKNVVLFRTCLVGDGPGATIFRAVGDINALHFQTGLGRSSHGGFSVVQDSLANRVGRGILVDQSQGIHLQDIEVKGFFTGIENRDTFSVNYTSIDLKSNVDGFNGINVVSGSHPNAINFNSVRFMYNTRRGCYLVNPTTCNFIGGSFEGNGSGNAGDGGLEVFGPSNEGAFGINVFGVYFEKNWGGSDLKISNGGASRVVQHSVEGCTFNRIDATKFVTNNVRIERPTNGFMRVLMRGNSFQGFGTYVANAARKYVVNLNTGGGAPATLLDEYNLYGNATEAP